jgi:hypothetical protein
MEVAETSASPETLSRLLLISVAKADVGASRSKLNASVGRTDLIVILFSPPTDMNLFIYPPPTSSLGYLLLSC